MARSWTLGKSKSMTGQVSGGIVVPGRGFAVCGKDILVQSMRQDASASTAALSALGWGAFAGIYLEIRCLHHDAKTLLLCGKPAHIELGLQGDRPDDWMPLISPGKMWQIYPLYQSGWGYPVEMSIMIGGLGGQSIPDDDADSGNFSPYSSYINAP